MRKMSKISKFNTVITNWYTVFYPPIFSGGFIWNLLLFSIPLQPINLSHKATEIFSTTDLSD